MQRDRVTSPQPALRLGLALQGGGSHGAYGWGVLHELLEADTIEIAALSGTSAGAINAVVYADGWLSRPNEPRRGAKDALARFWHLNAIASTALTGGMLRPSPWDMLHRDPTLKRNPLFLWFDLASRLFSQYDFNGHSNPLAYCSSIGMGWMRPGCEILQLRSCS